MEASFKNILFVAGVTMLTMFALNQAAGLSPVARRIIRGGSVTPVSTGTGAGLFGNILGPLGTST